MADQKIFDRPEENNPATSYRLAIGKVGTLTKNITLANLILKLNGWLNFLKPSNNLSDLTNKPAALTTLGGATTASVSALGSSKADKSNVLELNNTNPFVPALPYAPATKSYTETYTNTEVAELKVYESTRFVRLLLTCPPLNIANLFTAQISIGFSPWLPASVDYLNGYAVIVNRPLGLRDHAICIEYASLEALVVNVQGPETTDPISFYVFLQMMLV